jgi:hypothetical protein
MAMLVWAGRSGRRLTAARVGSWRREAPGGPVFVVAGVLGSERQGNAVSDLERDDCGVRCRVTDHCRAACAGGSDTDIRWANRSNTAHHARRVPTANTSNQCWTGDQKQEPCAASHSSSHVHGVMIGHGQGVHDPRRGTSPRGTSGVRGKRAVRPGLRLQPPHPARLRFLSPRQR